MNENVKDTIRNILTGVLVVKLVFAFFSGMLGLIVISNAIFGANYEMLALSAIPLSIAFIIMWMIRKMVPILGKIGVQPPYD
jgi:hypothetical protein